ncbi:hypothetical protein AGIG_G3388 [Arapaima gigas]
MLLGNLNRRLAALALTCASNAFLQPAPDQQTHTPAVQAKAWQRSVPDHEKQSAKFTIVHVRDAAPKLPSQLASLPQNCNIRIKSEPQTGFAVPLKHHSNHAFLVCRLTYTTGGSALIRPPLDHSLSPLVINKTRSSCFIFARCLFTTLQLYN